MSDLKRQVAKGAAWMVLFRLTDRVIGFVSTLILARLLVPADFGVVAMAISILAALELLSAFSFDIALIQNPNAERKHFDTAWTFGILFGAFNALCMCALAIPAAHFFGEPRVEALMYVFGLCSFIQGFENVGIVAFQKNLELHKEFVFSISKRLAGFVTTITLALLTGSYWSLAVGTLVIKVVGVALSYYVHPYRARLSLAAASELLHFSKWLLLNNFLIFLNNRGTDFIIGRLQGASALGVYSMSYELSNLPTTELVWPIQRAVFPGYTKVADDLVKLRSFFIQVIGFLCLLTVPAGALLGLAAEPVVQVLLGPKWASAVPLIQVLAVFGIVRAMHGPTGSVFMAIGKPFVVAVNQSVQIISAVALMFVLIPRMGTIGAAWAILAGALLALLSSYFLLTRLVKLPVAPLIAAVWRPVLGGVCMWLFTHWLEN
ncbi:MAG: lipopolysaccharide biosynthesis protein, partial [Rhizobacter sp.]